MYENTIPWDLLLEQRQVSYRLKTGNPERLHLAVCAHQKSHEPWPLCPWVDDRVPGGYRTQELLPSDVAVPAEAGCLG